MMANCIMESVIKSGVACCFFLGRRGSFCGFLAFLSFFIFLGLSGKPVIALQSIRSSKSETKGKPFFKYGLSAARIRRLIDQSCFDINLNIFGLLWEQHHFTL